MSINCIIILLFIIHLNISIFFLFFLHQYILHTRLSRILAARYTLVFYFSATYFLSIWFTSIILIKLRKSIKPILILSITNVSFSIAIIRSNIKISYHNYVKHNGSKLTKDFFNNIFTLVVKEIETDPYFQVSYCSNYPCYCYCCCCDPAKKCKIKKILNYINIFTHFLII